MLNGREVTGKQADYVRKVRGLKEKRGSGGETITLDESIKRWAYKLVKAGHPLGTIGDLSIDWIRMLEEERERRMSKRTETINAHLAQMKGGHFFRYVVDLNSDG